MNLFWLVPSLVLLLGAFGVAVLARRLADVTEQARSAQRRFRGVEHALIPVRVETRRVRASVDRHPRR